MKKVVVIPVYKLKLTQFEVFSLKACFRILCKHPIVFVAPHNLDLSYYQFILNTSFTVERFSSFYFEGICGYNKLLLSEEFYGRFHEYDYMLIYQLDCYVFRDEYDLWAESGYDFIGAPWLLFHTHKMRIRSLFNFYANRLNSFINNEICKEDLNYRVGNGGFSLRKTSSFLKVLENPDKTSVDGFYGNDSLSCYNEDVYWSIHARELKKPTYREACRFSLETSPELGFSINNNSLPFGCHGFERYLYFWRQHIQL